MSKPFAMFTSSSTVMLLVVTDASTHKNNEVVRYEWK